MLTLTSSRQCCSRWPSVSGPLDVAMKVLKTTEGILPGQSDSLVRPGGFCGPSWRKKASACPLVTGAGLRSDFEGAEHLSIYSARVPTFGDLLA